MLLHFVVLFVLASSINANSMVGPGAVGSYTGRRRRRSYGRVRDEAEGFVIAGSALEDMNGVYERERDTASVSYLPFKSVYKHERSSWLIGIMRNPDVRTGDEWVIVDNKGEIRFKHLGGTIIPGSGKRWTRIQLKKDSRMYNEKASGGSNDSTSVIQDNRIEIEDEFPWQIVFMGRRQMVTQLKNAARHTMIRRKKTLQGIGLPAVPSVAYSKQFETRPPTNSPCDGAPERVMNLIQSARDALEIRKNDNAAVMFEKALEHLNPFTKTFSNLRDSRKCVRFREGDENCNKESKNKNNNNNNNNACSDTIESERSGVCQCDKHVLVDLPCGHKSTTCEKMCTSFEETDRRHVQFQWCVAALRVALAKTQRANRDVTNSISNLEISLELFPRYKEALFEMGRTLLDQAGSASDSLRQFETVLRLDRYYPGLLEWMVRFV